ncbi:hypothetical protein [Rosistilla oblonga]|uniref:Uncharacterized protein n=1 Tax=Rosistilla oblonga TaxID=2527990 RepID=A0A518IUZ3_9BACT|nr:hypothetical protein [Rosistilla oblonga]QDV56899.1 hypothetical protein Mal33_29000 [Rosistilla oblonga]
MLSDRRPTNEGPIRGIVAARWGRARENRNDCRSLCAKSRPGYWTFKLPPLEAWGEAMRRLPETERSRLREPEFYEQLQAAILQRLAA